MIGSLGDARTAPWGWLAGSACVFAGLAATAKGQAPTAGATGVWSDLIDLRNVPVHAHVLPSGKLLYWARREAGENLDGVAGSTGKVAGIVPHLWDPATGKHDDPVAPGVPGYGTFCSGHAFLPDGRLLVAGGHITDADGLKKASLFDPGSGAPGGSWSKLPAMNAGHWYPSVLALANGEMLVASGSFKTFPPPGRSAGVDDLPQVLNASGTWRDLSGLAPLPPPNNGTTVMAWPLYPFLHVAPDGNVFMSGSLIKSRLFDPAGAGTFRRAWDHVHPQQRDFGSSVMYDVGKVVVVGGGDPPTETAEVIDLTAAAPAWKPVGSMSVRRRQFNATLLADGKVLVTGGTDGPGFNNLASPVFVAEAWDPVGGLWTRLAPASRPRQYHSTSLLLPDARVFNGGGGEYGDATPADDRPNAQVFSPPYLFRGDRPAPRPVITSAPEAVTYATPFRVETPSYASARRVTWVRLPSVTHAYDQNQRFNELAFQVDAGGLLVTPPPNSSHAPPGHYMLFVFADGMPSVARIIKIAGP